MASKTLLIDGNSLIHRAYHALPPLTTGSGQPTNAAFGFVQMLLALLEAEQPDVAVLALDAPGPTFRHELDPEYKANRAEMEEDLAAGKLIWSGFQRLSMVAGLNAGLSEAQVAPSAAEQELRDAILPSQARLVSPALHAVQAWRSSGSNAREAMRYGGLVGHVDVRPSASRPERLGLPQDLVDLLWALQVTHVGADVVFGCGRVRVEVIG